MKTVTYPKGPGDTELLGTEEFWYDPAGRVKFKKDGNGKITFYERDPLGRVVHVHYDFVTHYNDGFHVVPDLDDPLFESDYDLLTYDYYYLTIMKLPYDVQYGYEDNSTLVTSAAIWKDDGTEMASLYEYDDQGRLRTYTPPEPAEHAELVYTYNNLGQKTSITTDNYSVSYDYYANGWLKDVNSGAVNVAHYTYDAAGNRGTVTYGNNVTNVYAYQGDDPRYFIDSITYDRGGIELGKISYTNTAPSLRRDEMGNPRSMKD